LQGAEALYTLGHVLHLLEDMGVPAHVRNDFASGHIVRAQPDTTGMFIKRYFGSEGEEYKFEFKKALASLFSNPYELFVKNIADKGFSDTVGLINGTLFTRYTNSLNAPERPTFTSPEVWKFWDTTPDGGREPDTGQNQGLAEYSNANFLTISTIPGQELDSNVHRFDFPDIVDPISGTSPRYLICMDEPIRFKMDRLYSNISGVRLYDGAMRKYVTAKCPESGSIDHIAAVGFLGRDVDGAETNRDSIVMGKLWLDLNVYADYADRLIPRTVGYASALMDYFFRGKLEIRPTEALGVYALTDALEADGSPKPFTRIRANVVNRTAHVDAAGAEVGEPLSGGAMVAVAEYRPRAHYTPDLLADDTSFEYGTDALVNTSAIEYAYSISASVPLGADLAYGQGRDYAFDFSTKPIPQGVTDLALYVIYNGTVGAEQGTGVAVGREDVSEPTHLTIWNLTNLFSINGTLSDPLQRTLLTWDEADALNASRTDKWQIYPPGDVTMKLVFVNSPDYGGGDWFSSTGARTWFTGSLGQAEHGRVVYLAASDEALAAQANYTVSGVMNIDSQWRLQHLVASDGEAYSVTMPSGVVKNFAPGYIGSVMQHSLITFTQCSEQDLVSTSMGIRIGCYLLPQLENLHVPYVPIPTPLGIAY
jgi:hypothetical protein